MQCKYSAMQCLPGRKALSATANPLPSQTQVRLCAALGLHTGKAAGSAIVTRTNRGAHETRKQCRLKNQAFRRHGSKDAQPINACVPKGTPLLACYLNLISPTSSGSDFNISLSAIKSLAGSFQTYGFNIVGTIPFSPFSLEKTNVIIEKFSSSRFLAIA